MIKEEKIENGSVHWRWQMEGDFAAVLSAKKWDSKDSEQSIILSRDIKRPGQALGRIAIPEEKLAEGFYFLFLSLYEGEEKAAQTCPLGIFATGGSWRIKWTAGDYGRGAGTQLTLLIENERKVPAGHFIIRNLSNNCEYPLFYRRADGRDLLSDGSVFLIRKIPPEYVELRVKREFEKLYRLERGR